jgi:hypothetical protein
MGTPGWIKILITEIDLDADLVNRIREKGLVYYCLLQLFRALFLVVYSLMIPKFQYILLTSLLITVPLNSITIFLSKYNFKRAARIYLLINFLMFAGFLFSARMTETISSVMIINFFSLAILALVAINGVWASVVLILGLLTLAVDYLIYFNGDFGLTITNSGNEVHGTVMNGFNITCIFAYFIFFVNSFVHYYKLYKHELALRTYLSRQLTSNYRDLVQKKAELEEHMKALETATTRFKKYSWMNSNTMRRPLEKIKRLAELYELRDKKETLHDQILEATVELDKVVREMNGLLEAVPKAKMLTRPLHPEPAQRR